MFAYFKFFRKRPFNEFTVQLTLQRESKVSTKVSRWIHSRTDAASSSAHKGFFSDKFDVIVVVSHTEVAPKAFISKAETVWKVNSGAGEISREIARDWMCTVHVKSLLLTSRLFGQEPRNVSLKGYRWWGKHQLNFRTI